MDGEEENVGPFRRTSTRTRRMATRMASALASSDNRAQAALARLEALESDNAGVEVVDLNDDKYGSTDEEDPGQFPFSFTFVKHSKIMKRKTRQGKALEKRAARSFMDVLQETEPFIRSAMVEAHATPATPFLPLTGLHKYIAIFLVVLSWILVHKWSLRKQKGPRSWPVIGATGDVYRSYMDVLLGDGIFNADGELWRKQRKTASFEFASKNLRDFSAIVFREYSLKLSGILSQASKAGKVVDMQELYMRMTLDSICKVGFGVEIGTLSPDLPENSFAQAFDAANIIVTLRFIDPLWRVKRFLHVGSEALLEQSIKLVDEFTYSVIRRRKAEIVEARASGKQEKFASLLNYDSLGKLVYLHACVTETLRLYPAVPQDPKGILEDDVLPDGTKVRAGGMVTYVPYSMGRMEYNWGADAATFRPERWINEDGAFRNASPFKFTAFQAGPRICLGKDSAYLQMKMALAILCRFYRFQLLEGHPVEYRMMTILSMAHGLKLRVSRAV
ncbi:Cytochrome P450 86B1 [Panicum miliaceum]|uniref:Cytochrome P450 86B1 n=1 Tax=Panicum miliaceum TaxID=4540 RepID=A0A3L6SEG8_PANMI|nr:Cytochrome P450 86B1 [Panicum miliaceum]